MNNASRFLGWVQRRKREATKLSEAITEQLPAITGKVVKPSPEDKAVQIPRIFWYACAYGVVVITSGISFSAFRSTSSSVEAFGTKLELSRALEREKQVLQTVERLADAPAPQPPLMFMAPLLPAPAPVPDLPAKVKAWRNANEQQQQQITPSMPQQQQQGQP